MASALERDPSYPPRRQAYPTRTLARKGRLRARRGKTAGAVKLLQFKLYLTN